MEKTISVHLTRNDLDNISKWSQISYTFFWLLDSFDDSSESSSVNRLSYHQCSYSWFDRVDFLLILEIWSLSLGLVFRSFFLIWCFEILESLSFLILSFFWRCKSFPPHRSLFVIYFFYKKDLWLFFSLTFWSV